MANDSFMKFSLPPRRTGVPLLKKARRGELHILTIKLTMEEKRRVWRGTGPGEESSARNPRGPEVIEQLVQESGADSGLETPARKTTPSSQ